jgi:putative hydrolase of the HAD superfamily
MIRAVFFDFGGVLADEGFREGLKVIGKRNGLDPEQFFSVARELIHRTGYVTGTSDEANYWDTIRKATGIKGSDRELRRIILDRFRLREGMIGMVKKVRALGLITALLSDQTNWLDEINRKTPFYRHFDFVFNSYVLKKSKRDISLFRQVCAIVGIKPREALFIDDDPENTKKAQAAGMSTILFRDTGECEKALGAIIQNYPAAG